MSQHQPRSGAPLTPRERQVIVLLAQGLSNKLIAVQLGVTDHTAKFHVDRVIKKMGATTRTEAAVIYATREAFARGFDAGCVHTRALQSVLAAA